MAEIAELGPSEISPQVIAARSATYKAIRVFYLAEAYGFGRDRDFSKAYVLYRRAQDLAKQALDAYKQSVAPAATDEKDIAKLKQTIEAAQAQSCLVHAEGLLDSIRKDDEVRNKVSQLKLDETKSPVDGHSQQAVKPLLDRLDSFEAGRPEQFHSLVSLPPDYEAVACKPILFDLAFNTLQFPDVTSRIKAKQAPAPATSTTHVPIIRSNPVKKNQPDNAETNTQPNPKPAEQSKASQKPEQKKEEPQPQPKKGGVAGAIGAVGGVLGKLWGRGNNWPTSHRDPFVFSLWKMKCKSGLLSSS